MQLEILPPSSKESIKYIFVLPINRCFQEIKMWTQYKRFHHMKTGITENCSTHFYFWGPLLAKKYCIYFKHIFSKTSLNCGNVLETSFWGWRSYTKTKTFSHHPQEPLQCTISENFYSENHNQKCTQC